MFEEAGDRSIFSARPLFGTHFSVVHVFGGSQPSGVLGLFSLLGFSGCFH